MSPAEQKAQTRGCHQPGESAGAVPFPPEQPHALQHARRGEGGGGRKPFCVSDCSGMCKIFGDLSPAQFFCAESTVPVLCASSKKQEEDLFSFSAR